MPLALMPVSYVAHTTFGTFVGSHPMSYTSVDFTRIRAAIRPGVASMAHRYVTHKFSLLDAKFKLTFMSFNCSEKQVLPKPQNCSEHIPLQ